MNYKQLAKLEQLLEGIQKTVNAKPTDLFLVNQAFDEAKQIVADELDSQDIKLASGIKHCQHGEVEFNKHNIPFCLNCGKDLLDERSEVMADMEYQRQKEESYFD